MYAVDLDRYGMILFSQAMPAEHLRRELVEEMGGKLLEGVTLSVPPDVRKKSDNNPAPDAVLSVSHSDPLHYEVIKYRDQVGPLSFRVVGRIYGVLDPESGWETFLKSFKILDKIARDARGVEVPDSAEAP